MPLLNLSDVQTLGMHQHGGGMSPLVEVYDGDHDDPLAYIQYKRRPLRGCATIMLAVLTFFTFPVAVGFMAHALSQATGTINPLGMDQQQSIVLMVVAWIVVVRVGILATMFMIRLTSPRQRTTIFTDHE